MGQRRRALESLVMFGDFYRSKRVLLTGHTGFKGAWMGFWLQRLGAQVHGLALPPESPEGAYSVFGSGIFASEAMVDIRDAEATAKAIRATAPEVVFHLAAQPLVRKAYAEPLETVATNVMGTAHVLNALRDLPNPPRAIVVVTSDKCYENQGWHQGYRETDPMGGYDPYSASKGASEIIASAWRRSYFHESSSPRLACARGGNVIGGGDWAADRLVPDCIRSLRSGASVDLRNPGATRPWQHVLDCVSGYLALAAKLASNGKNESLCSGFNFGPLPASVKDVRALVTEVLKHWPGEWRDLSGGKAPHEAQFLQLAIEKAAALLDWRPVWDFATTVQQTIKWYRCQHEGANMPAITDEQLAQYEEEARAQRVAWTDPV